MSKEFRRLSAQKRIESPIAKYNSTGQLTCIVCNQIVKSELMWNAHINSKSHLEAKNQLKMKLIAEQAKPISSQSEQTNTKTSITSSALAAKPNKLKEKSTASDDNKINMNQQNMSLKRSNPESSSVSVNSELLLNNKKQKMDQLIQSTDSIDLNKRQSTNKTEKSAETTLVNSLSESSKSNPADQIASAALANTPAVVGSALPEGFFDDPDLDAQIRGQSREANLEAEYEEFKKIIQTEEFKSDILIEQDDKLRDYDRDIEEVDHLIDRWNKIESLHQRREAIKQQHAAAASNANSKSDEKMDQDEHNEEEDDDDDEQIDLENVLNLALRSKNRF